MITCPNCGRQMDDVCKFCKSCGTRLSASPTASPTPPGNSSRSLIIGALALGGLAVILAVVVCMMVVNRYKTPPVPPSLGSQTGSPSSSYQDGVRDIAAPPGSVPNPSSPLADQVAAAPDLPLLPQGESLVPPKAPTAVAPQELIRMAEEQERLGNRVAAGEQWRQAGEAYTKLGMDDEALQCTKRAYQIAKDTSLADYRNPSGQARSVEQTLPDSKRRTGTELVDRTERAVPVEANRQPSNALVYLVRLCHLFSDATANKGRFPKTVRELIPVYIKDVTCLRHPDRSDEDVGYYYVPGLTPVDGDAKVVVAYEAPPKGTVPERYLVISPDCTVESLTGEQFKTWMENTRKRLEDRGIDMKPEPVSVASLPVPVKLVPEATREEQLRKLLDRITEEDDAGAAQKLETEKTPAQMLNDLKQRLDTCETDVAGLKAVPVGLLEEVRQLRKEVQAALDGRPEGTSKTDLSRLSERVRVTQLRVLTSRAKEAANGADDN